MIIRMTVQDNDYWFELKDFASRLSSRLIANSDMETYIKIITLFRSNETERHTETDSSFVLKEINYIWSKYIDDLKYDEQIKHYLISNFFVEIINSFREKWENGEYVYYFSNSNVVITQ